MSNLKRRIEQLEGRGSTLQHLSDEEIDAKLSAAGIVGSTEVEMNAALERLRGERRDEKEAP